MTIHEWIKEAEKKETIYLTLWHNYFKKNVETKGIGRIFKEWRVAGIMDEAYELGNLEIPKTPGQELDEIINIKYRNDVLDYNMAKIKDWRAKHKDLLDK